MTTAEPGRGKPCRRAPKADLGAVPNAGPSASSSSGSRRRFVAVSERTTTMWSAPPSRWRSRMRRVSRWMSRTRVSASIPTIWPASLRRRSHERRSPIVGSGTSRATRQPEWTSATKRAISSWWPRSTISSPFGFRPAPRSRPRRAPYSHNRTTETWSIESSLSRREMSDCEHPSCRAMLDCDVPAERRVTTSSLTKVRTSSRPRLRPRSRRDCLEDI